MLSSRRTIESIFMHTCPVGWSGCEEPDGSRISCRGPLALSNPCCPVCECGLLPSPELKNSVALCIDPKASHGKLACERLLKMLAIPGLDVKNTLLIQRRVPPMSYLMRYDDFLLHSSCSSRFAAQGRANPITIQPPFRVEPISWNLTMH